MSSGFFITGTDTEVGKTVATAAITRLLLDRGLSVGVMKPVQSGAVKQKGKWVSGDMEFVRSVIKIKDPAMSGFSNPYLLKRPLAPNLAAKKEKISIKIDFIKKEYGKLAERYQFVLLEGAGGLMVPINGKEFMADIALSLEVPIIVVARPSLGTINHTLLTINNARDMGIEVLGLIFNYVRKGVKQGEKEAMDFIKRASGVPVLGIIPYISGLDVNSMKLGGLINRLKIDLKPLLRYVATSRKRKERTRRIKDLDKSFVWHPFTQMRDWIEEDPLMIERGEGSYIIDADGNRYLDGVSSIWVTTHGHRKRELNQGIKNQLNKIAHSTMLGLGNVSSAVLAQKLVEISPRNLRKVFYSDCGSTAVEIGLKMAYQYWLHKEGMESRRSKFVYLDQSYHGDTLGAMGVGGIDLFHELFRPLLFDSYKVPNPYCYRCPVNKSYPSCDLACADEAEKLLRVHAGEIAALIIEPMVQGASGIIVFPQGYLKKMVGLCKKYGILFIADEVATGFGRTGKMFACEHEKIEPDILCVAKGITGGYLPLAATLATEEIFSVFLGEYKDLKTFFHGHTYTGNPLACAAALENIEIYKKEKTLQKMKKKIDVLQKGLKKFHHLKHVGNIRQLGFMVGIELVKDKETREPFSLEEKAGIRVVQEARRKGVVIRPLGNVAVMVPHLSFSQKEIMIMLNTVYNSIRDVLE